MTNIEFYKCKYSYDHYIKEQKPLVIWTGYPYCPHKGDFVYIDNVQYRVVKTIIKFECVEVHIEQYVSI